MFDPLIAGAAPTTALVHSREDAPAAADRLDRVLQRVPAAHRVARVSVLELAVRTHLALDDPAAAASALEELGPVAASVGTEPFRAAVAVAEGLVAMADSQPARARNRFEDAVELLTGCGATVAAARARVELATSLAALASLFARHATSDDPLLAFPAEYLTTLGHKP